MKKVKIIFLILLCGTIISCDYSAIKKENKELKKQLFKVNQIELERQEKERQKLYLKSIRKYAVAIINYKQHYGTSRPNPFSNEVVNKYRKIHYVSNILEVSTLLSDDDKQRILDDKFQSQDALMSPNILLNKELHIFNTYSEASDFMTKERNPNN